MQSSKRNSGGHGQVQSISRALTLLNKLSEADQGLNLTDLAVSLGLAASTTHRLLNSLLEFGFVEADEQTGHWQVGLEAFRVGNAYLKKRDFVMMARPFMKALVAATGETSNLAILENTHHVFVGQVECSEVMRMVVQIGSRGAPYASGVGKALLSALPERQVMAIVSATGMEKFTDNTIASPADLVSELSDIRSRGYALDDEEQSIGLRCVAANIYDEFGEALAAISISGPTARIRNERIPLLSAEILKTTNLVTQAIGGCKPGR